MCMIFAEIHIFTFFFFFSSRRRHTRCSRDWSSDVCSSDLYSLNFNLALVFGGASSIVMGSLILRATFVPRIIGPLMILDGLGYLTFSLAAFLSPSLAARIFPYIPFVTAAIGEGALFLWLIVKGVNAERWQEQAATMDRGALEEARIEVQSP